MMITKDNYRAHEEYCFECLGNVPLTFAEIHTDPDRDELWRVCCPQCGEPLLHFWKEEPNWEVLTPEAWTAVQWRTLENLQSHLRQPPNDELIASIPPMIDKISYRVFPAFFGLFDWKHWSLGVHLSTAKEASAFRELDFPQALALLFAFYRAERFNDYLLYERWESGMLTVLVDHL